MKIHIEFMKRIQKKNFCPVFMNEMNEEFKKRKRIENFISDRDLCFYIV